MIPKILHFIWLGDQVPAYAEYSMLAYKKLNPSFKINFVHLRIDELLKSEDSDVIEALNAIYDTCSGKYNKYYNYINTRNKWNLSFISLFTDLLRCILLDNHGGIYLDCDTYPLKPFDDELLNRSNFSVEVTTLYDKKRKYFKEEFKRNNLLKNFPLNPNQLNYDEYKFYDIYFIGAKRKWISSVIEATEYGEIKFTNSAGGKITAFKNENSYIFQRNAYDFKRCKLDIDSYSNIKQDSYVIHFCIRYWLNNTNNISNYTLYDDSILNKKILLVIHLKSASDIQNAIDMFYFVRTLYHKIDVKLSFDDVKINGYIIENLPFKLSIDIAEDEYLTVFNIDSDKILTGSIINSIYDFTFNKIEYYCIIDSIVSGVRIHAKGNRFYETIGYGNKCDYSNIKYFVDNANLKHNNKFVNICCITDENYLNYAISMLKSVKQSKDNLVKYNIFIVVPLNIKNKAFEMFSKLEDSSFSVNVIPYDNLFFFKEGKMNASNTKYITSNTYIRLLLDQILPKCIKKVLYLDCDIRVKEDLYSLYSIDMNEKTISGVYDFGTRYYKNFDAEHRIFYKYAESFIKHYINAGVLVIDLELYRNKHLRMKSYDNYLIHHDFKFADLDIINSSCYDEINLIDTKYNMQLGYMKEVYSTRIEIDKDAVIEHFIGTDKKLKIA